jgi:hypothetical protein
MFEEMVLLDLGKAIVLHKYPMAPLLMLVSWIVTFFPTLRTMKEGNGILEGLLSRKRKGLLVLLRDCGVENGVYS